MTVDKYTKAVLTVIAVGLLGINIHLFTGGLIKNAYASDVLKVQICDSNGYFCADVSSQSLQVTLE